MVTGGARAVARCDALGVPPYSDTDGGLFRAYLTPGFAHTQEAVGAWMVEAGMSISLDPAANLVGRYEGREPGSPALLIGSHLDSVRDAGRYDGPLGVLLGIEAVAALAATGRRLPFAIEVIGFGDEEGSRFPASMLTSRAVAGTLDPAALHVADASGVTLAAALQSFNPTEERRQAGTAVLPREPLGLACFATAARPRGSVLAYLETHIEQGPVLEAEGLPVGIVTGIAAQLRYRLTLTGMAGHAGTTTMALRHDALAAAAEVVLAAERVARGADGLVATVGQLAVKPGAANVIPGRVTLSLDVRSLDAQQRDSAAAAILAEARVAAERRGVALVVEQVNDLAASHCDPGLRALLADAVAATGTTPFHLPSGAGHDAMILAALCPTAMLFVRCRGGISHNPAEHVEPADAEVALRSMLGFIDRLESIA